MKDSSAPDPDTGKPEGTILADHFRIEAVLGGGGMSIVYKCIDTRLGRIVAVKEMQSDRLADDRSHVRFHQEAKAVGKLNHPHIVKLHEFKLVDETPYIVMDYIDGMPLSQLIATSGKLSQDRSLDIAIQVADALEHAHEHSVVHRDLKPGNIMLRQNGSVVLVDFGIAKLATTAASIKATQTGEVFGSPAYMSPEQVSGRGADARTDQYALGCILFECLTGRPPFVGNAALEVMFQHLNDVPPQAALYLQRSVDPTIEDIIAKLLQKEPANRFEDMAAVKRSLQAARDNLAGAKQDRWPLSGQNLPRALSVVLIATFALAISLAVYHGQKPAAKGDAQPAVPKPMSVQTATQLDTAEERSLIEDWIAAHKAAGARGLVDVLSARHTKRQPTDHSTYDPYTATNVFTITNADLERLSDLHGMTIIDIENCENVTGAGLSKLDGRNVTELSCKESRFNDEDLNSLANFPKLQGLNLSSTRITNKGLAMLLLKAPDLHSLVINSCPSITDDAFAALVKMPHLQALDLRQDAIGAKGISWLGKSKLVHIKISGTNVTDEDLKVIGQNKNLRELFLDGCHHITGTGFKYLTSLPLKFLDIGDCKLSPGTLSAFRRAEPNCRLLYTREKFVGGQVVGVMDLFKP